MGMFKSNSEKAVNKCKKTLNKVNALRNTMKDLSDDELKAKTIEFKERLAAGEKLDALLPEAFAVCREATYRVLNMEQYDVQVIGGIIIHQGRIAELKTGEGKTITIYLPAYLNALTEKGVHIVTVNDYLVERDANQARQVFEFLGMTVGTVLQNGSTASKKEAYNCDITYVTNNELGFDYLRDNMAISMDGKVIRGLNYVIIDEADNVLIDEARTPLIISGIGKKTTDLFQKADEFVKTLTRGEAKEVSKLDSLLYGETASETGDYIYNEKDHQIYLTEQGNEKAEEYFHITTLTDLDNIELKHCIENALVANYRYHLNVDYIVRDNEVLIVDEFTGRTLKGRRYSNGLHQAIEAKEGIEVKGENKTLASITFQNFFTKYNKMSGMTGTAITEENEFIQIYGVDVVAIPTNKPVIREDHNDIIYMTKEEKYQAVIDDIIATHAIGQPVLVGTTNVEVSELLSEKLTEAGIPHNVLNAKQHALEAQIVAEAGKFGAVTIATNMAGRGTDIKLDEEALKAGGLKVIGTERHESRRIDNQLRGRSGRQGDPGESVFYLSLDDDLLRLFTGIDKIKELCSIAAVPGMALQHTQLSAAVEKAQKHLEAENFAIREDVKKYDEVINVERNIVYEERDKMLQHEDIHDNIVHFIDTIVDGMCSLIGTGPDEEVISLITEQFSLVFGRDITLDEYVPELTDETLRTELTRLAHQVYAEKQASCPDEKLFYEAERICLLKNLDRHWQNHIDELDDLRQYIGFQAMANKDPLVEYTILAHKGYDEMVRLVNYDTITSVLNTEFIIG